MAAKAKRQRFRPARIRVFDGRRSSRGVPALLLASNTEAFVKPRLTPSRPARPIRDTAELTQILGPGIVRPALLADVDFESAESTAAEAPGAQVRSSAAHLVEGSHPCPPRPQQEAWASGVSPKLSRVEDVRSVRPPLGRSPRPLSQVRRAAASRAPSARTTISCTQECLERSLA